MNLVKSRADLINCDVVAYQCIYNVHLALHECPDRFVKKSKDVFDAGYIAVHTVVDAKEVHTLPAHIVKGVLKIMSESSGSLRGLGFFT